MHPSASPARAPRDVVLRAVIAGMLTSCKKPDDQAANTVPRLLFGHFDAFRAAICAREPNLDTNTVNPEQDRNFVF
jgi:hypothetical protein